ncbi:hypothetical protein QZH41_011267 [Actinostola sp. cb2023]|nr:hypothetical protein QZH41_011267 [Actinostola sp. cb2023]
MEEASILRERYGAAEEEFTTSTTPDRSDKKMQGFESLSEEDKEKVRGIVYIMVRFSVSNEAYHELTQVVGGEQLPRSYLVEGCTKFLDSKLDLLKTPGTCPGAELPFKDLLEMEIRNCIKIAGDGAKMSRTSSLFVFSFALLNDTNTCLSSAGTHTIAAIKTAEDYSKLNLSLGNVIKDVNSLIEQGSLEIDNLKVNLEFFHGGDYKFLLIAMGMKAANSSHSCIWCKDFRKLFEIFTANNPTEAQITGFHSEALLWARHLMSMNNLQGYSQNNPITPYIHILIYHAGDILQKYGSLKIFSGQEVEKKNDDFRRYFTRKINRWDACASMLKVEKRQELLRNKERVSRRYRKLNDEFWFCGGKQKSAAQVQRISCQQDEEMEDHPSTNPSFSEQELKRKSRNDLVLILEGLTMPVNKKMRKQELIDKIVSFSNVHA